MADWLDPEAWQSVAKTAATLLDALIKVRDRLSRKQGGSARKLDQEIDALQADLQRVVDLMATFVSHINSYFESVARQGKPHSYLTLLKEVATTIQRISERLRAHEERLKKLEGAARVRARSVRKHRRR
jgi:hypothetical protein